MKKNLIYLITIFCFFIFFLVIFKTSTGNMLVDFSRESYIPYQMLEGKVLFKDIFTIYGIFGYIINLFIYKISINFNLLIFLSGLISLLTAYIFYFICLKYLKIKYLALIFTLGFISLSIFSNSTFSFILPYSYSTLWAVFGIYCTLLAILNKKPNLAFLSLGLVFANRIEYFIPAIIISLIYYALKKENIFKSIIYVCIFPVINLIYIIASNIKLTDILNNYNYVVKMANTNSISYLYKSSGTFFEPKNFFINLIIIAVLSLILFLTCKYKKFTLIGAIITIVSIICINPNESLNLVAIPIILYLIFNFKKFNSNELLLFFLSITLCAKSIFKTGTLSYSNFGFFLLILFLYLVLEKIFENKSKIPTILLATYIITSNIFNFYYFLKNPKLKVKTETGTLYVRNYEEELFIQLNDFLDRNLKDNETFTIVPEGQIFNLIKKKPHNHFNSTFTPLDFETFKEENIIKEFRKNPPKYVVFFPRNTADYGKPTICYNYGIDFCLYIMHNYQRKAILDAKFKALIFEKNNEK